MRKLYLRKRKRIKLIAKSEVVKPTSMRREHSIIGRQVTRLYKVTKDGKEGKPLPREEPGGLTARKAAPSSARSLL